jgi:hypothetical protein
LILRRKKRRRRKRHGKWWGLKNTKKIKKGEEEFPPCGIFGFIHANDGGRKDKYELDVKGPKKNTPWSSPSLDATDCQKLEWRCFQTRLSSTDDAVLLNTKDGRMWMGKR